MLHREALCFAMASPVDPRSVAGKNPAPERRVPWSWWAPARRARGGDGGGPGRRARPPPRRAPARPRADGHGRPALLRPAHEPGGARPGRHAGARRPGQPRARGGRRRRRRGGAGRLVWGAFRPGPIIRELGACVGVADQTRSWLVGYDRLVVAAGARDLALAFRGWEKAGTMGAAGALALLTRYRALAARRMVVLGSGPLGLAVATLARARGVEVPAVVEVAPALRGDAGARRPARARRRPLLPGPRRAAGAAGAATSSRGSASPRSTATSDSRDGAESPATRSASPSAWCPGRAAPGPGLPARVPLRARGVRPRDRRAGSAPACPTSSRPATSPASTSAPCWRRSAGRGGGPARGARRGGLARDDRRPSAPRRSSASRVPATRAGPRVTTTGGSGSAPRSRPAAGTSSPASARRSPAASWSASSRRATSARARRRCAPGASAR